MNWFLGRQKSLDTKKPAAGEGGTAAPGAVMIHVETARVEEIARRLERGPIDELKVAGIAGKSDEGAVVIGISGVSDQGVKRGRFCAEPSSLIRASPSFLADTSVNAAPNDS